MNPSQKIIISTITNILGVDEAEVTPEAEFHLDLNATLEEMLAIKSSLEESLDIILPDFDTQTPQTVQDLIEMVSDASL